MLKLCYKNNDKRTDEYYFDLQSINEQVRDFA